MVAVAMYARPAMFSPLATSVMIVAVIALGPMLSWMVQGRTLKLARGLAVAVLLAVAVTIYATPTYAAAYAICDYMWWALECWLMY